jgi:hypothetical protein
MELAKKKFDQLKTLLSSISKPHRAFADQFYKQCVNLEASDEELYNHYDRFKSNCKRNAEIAALYLESFRSIYGEPISDDAKKAAWDFYIEISDRISYKELKDGEGDEASALTSLHSLFKTRRDTLKRYGSNSKDFADFSEEYMDSIRNFTTKWHNSIVDDNKQLFRKELKQLQSMTKDFIEQLNQRYKFKSNNDD